MGGERHEQVRGGAQAVVAAVGSSAERSRPIGDGERCDACGEWMQRMGHCKWLCRCCGFLRTCIDTV
jgi:hypothetical protein